MCAHSSHLLKFGAVRPEQHVELGSWGGGRGEGGRRGKDVCVCVGGGGGGGGKERKGSVCVWGGGGGKERKGSVCVCVGGGGGGEGRRREGRESVASAKREAHEAQILTCFRLDSQTLA